ncbi:phage tail tip lysozyme [Entomobacter blattae]|uniref:Phage tail lysozyme n=1 Tax=Entomobacter blattae TaxID=2762277 RepID=A0A7H1NU43_9PROT|nr:phage tail tip lysozyme [Entomobacter blattae]QNT79303.1 Phage tail lysozyme [Entomobacter blattae]
MADKDYFFGVTLDMDASGFIGGSADAQDAAKALLAGLTNTDRKARAAIKTLGQALGATPTEIKRSFDKLKSIRDEDLTEQQRYGKETLASVIALYEGTTEYKNRQVREEKKITDQGVVNAKRSLTTQRQQAAEEARIMRYRRDNVASLRDTLLSLAAVAAGGASLSAIAKTVTSVAQQGADIARVAERIQVDPKNLYKWRVAGLLGGASQEEGQQALEAIREEQTDVLQRNGTGGRILHFARDVLGIGDAANLDPIELVRRMDEIERARDRNQGVRSTDYKETAGFSGNVANWFANFGNFQQSMSRAGDLTKNYDVEADKRLDKNVREIQAQWGRFQYAIAHDIEPSLEAISKIISEAAEFAERHPDAANRIAESVALFTAATGIVLAIGGVFVPIRAALGIARSTIAMAKVVETEAAAATVTSKLGNLARFTAAIGIVGTAIQVIITALDLLSKFDGTKKALDGITGKQIADAQVSGSGSLASIAKTSNKTDAVIPGPLGPLSYLNPISPARGAEIPYRPYMGGMGNIGGVGSSGRTDALVELFQKEGGYTRDQSIGIVANLVKESSLNEKSDKGDGGLAYGLGQWHPDRQALFKKWSGKDIHSSSFIDQARFIIHELNTTEKRANAKLKAARNAYEAAGAFVDYERPRDRVGEQRSRGQIADNLIKNLHQTQAFVRNGLAAGGNTMLAAQRAAGPINTNTSTDNSTSINIHGPINVNANSAKEFSRSVQMAALPNAWQANTGTQ